MVAKMSYTVDSCSSPRTMTRHFELGNSKDFILSAKDHHKKACLDHQTSGVDLDGTIFERPSKRLKVYDARPGLNPVVPGRISSLASTSRHINRKTPRAANQSPNRTPTTHPCALSPRKSTSTLAKYPKYPSKRNAISQEANNRIFSSARGRPQASREPCAVVARPSRSMPFVIDDSLSEDNDSVKLKPAKRDVRYKSFWTSLSPSVRETSQTLKEAQRLESILLREKAEERKKKITTVSTPISSKLRSPQVGSGAFTSICAQEKYWKNTSTEDAHERLENSHSDLPQGSIPMVRTQTTDIIHDRHHSILPEHNHMESSRTKNVSNLRLIQSHFGKGDSNQIIRDYVTDAGNENSASQQYRRAHSSESLPVSSASSEVNTYVNAEPDLIETRNSHSDRRRGSKSETSNETSASTVHRLPLDAANDHEVKPRAISKITQRSYENRNRIEMGKSEDQKFETKNSKHLDPSFRAHDTVVDQAEPEAAIEDPQDATVFVAKSTSTSNLAGRFQDLKPCKEAAEAALRRNVADKARDDEFEKQADEQRAKEIFNFTQRKDFQESQRRAAVDREKKIANEQKVTAQRNASFSQLMRAVKESTGSQCVKEAVNSETPRQSDPKKLRSSPTPGSSDAPAIAIAQAEADREEALRVRRHREQQLELRKRQREQEEKSSQAHRSTVVRPIIASAEAKLDGSQTEKAVDNSSETLSRDASQQQALSPSRDRQSAHTDSEAVAQRPISLQALASQSSAALIDIDRQQSKAKVENRRTGALHSIQSRNHDAKIGEILPEDITIMKWRDSGMVWSQIKIAYGQQFRRQAASDTTLRRRYKQVKRAINESGVSGDLLDLVAVGNPYSTHKLNLIIRGQGPPPEPAVKLKDGEEFGSKKQATHIPKRISDQLRPLSTGQNPQVALHNGSELPLARRSPESIGKIDNDAYGTDQEISASKRQSTAGKTLTAETFQYYLQTLVEEFEKLDGADSDTETICSNDYCRYAYQVIRRELSALQLENGGEVENEDWITCSPLLDNLKEANAQAASQVYRSRHSRQKFFSSSHTVTCEYDADGLATLELTTGAGGIVQVRTTRQLRTFKEGNLPRNRQDDMSRTLYLINQTTTTTTSSEDGLFEDSRKSKEERDLDNTAYTNLEMANWRAIKHFVSLTFESKSINLKIRQLEVQKREQEILHWLQEQGEEALFCLTAEDEAGSTKIEVRVEPGRLAGPRNI